MPLNFVQKGMSVIVNQDSGGIDTSDATAKASDIASGVTAYGADGKITGTLPLFPSSRTFTVSDANVTLDNADSELQFSTINSTKQILDSNVPMTFAGNYSDVATAAGITADKIKSGETILGVTGNVTPGVNTSDATATADRILSGSTAYVKGSKVTGTLEYGTTLTTAGSMSVSDTNSVTVSEVLDSNFCIYSSGSTPRQVQITLTAEQVATAIGLTADKIVTGTTILGIAGTGGSGSQVEPTT